MAETKSQNINKTVDTRQFNNTKKKKKTQTNEQDNIYRMKSKKGWVKDLTWNFGENWSWQWQWDTYTKGKWHCKASLMLTSDDRQ